VRKRVLILDQFSSMFFEHQRGQKLGLWVLAIDTGLLVGPLSKSITNPHLETPRLIPRQLVASWISGAKNGSIG
jgi:hypothetical protein